MGVLQEEQVTLLGVDGSQIYLDPTEPLPWGHGHFATGATPRNVSIPRGTSLGKWSSGRNLIETIRFSLELKLASQCA